jgi:hypothetical protein
MKRFLILCSVLSLAACAEDPSTSDDDTIINAGGKADEAQTIVGAYTVRNASAVTIASAACDSVLYQAIQLDGQASSMNLHDPLDPNLSNDFDGNYVATLLDCTENGRVVKGKTISGLYQVVDSPEDGNPLLETFDSKGVFAGEIHLRFSTTGIRLGNARYKRLAANISILHGICDDGEHDCADGLFCCDTAAMCIGPNETCDNS